MSVLVDTSIWIDYFRGTGNTVAMDELIDNGCVVINDLILAELVPVLKIRKQPKVISLLNAMDRVPMSINWSHIIDIQVQCIRKGINKVGIPDLIIAQNAMQNKLELYSTDKHFRLISKHILLTMY